MTLSLAAKKAVVEEVNAIASKAISAVVADYRGLTVNQMTQLRAQARKSNVYLRVVPNNLARRAFEKTDFACLSERLVGPLFVAMSTNSILNERIASLNSSSNLSNNSFRFLL